MSKPDERLDRAAGKCEPDYRTFQAESIRLPGETAIDKCVRLAARLQMERVHDNLALDLPNPNLPKVFDEIDIPTFLLYMRVALTLPWLEAAAVRTYRKNRKRALARLYSNLEKESGVSQQVFRDIRFEFKVEHEKFLDKIAKCVLRKPVHDPMNAPQSLRRMVRRTKGNIIHLRYISWPKKHSRLNVDDRQQLLPL